MIRQRLAYIALSVVLSLLVGSIPMLLAQTRQSALRPRLAGQFWVETIQVDGRPAYILHDALKPAQCVLMVTLPAGPLTWAVSCE